MADMSTLTQEEPRSRVAAPAPLWVPARRWTAIILLVAGDATLATTFAALPAAVLAGLVAAWTVAVILLAQSTHGPAGFTVLSVCVKLTTLMLIALLIFDPTSPVAPENGLYWIPLGLLNMGSGLWFLKVIRKRAA
jgi:hypothetical protein